jgi:hypothetical protein
MIHCLTPMGIHDSLPDTMGKLFKSDGRRLEIR